MGAIKIKDGLFIGDEFSAQVSVYALISLIIVFGQDLEFITANKVTHIVNCAGNSVRNMWENIGIAYLSFNWVD